MKKFKQRTINGKETPLLAKTKRNSEFQSYTYIKNELKELGWNVKNLNRDVNGQLYTQQECLGNPEIKSMLGKLTPEYVVKLKEDAFWVIEAKPTHEQINQAYEEAVEYGELINKHKFIRAIIVSGVAGNDIDRYVVKSGFWEEDKKKFTPIEYNKKEITGLISSELAKTLLGVNSPFLKDLEIDEKHFVKIAEQINQIFHASSIKKDKRATIVATILLSLLGETEPNYNANPTVFVDDINTRAFNVLKENKKGVFFQYIQIQLPEKIAAQRKFKESLVTAFFLLKKVNIKAAMRTGSDILGKMYETFLKYGNGAKDLGILLTPRQITKFSADALDVTHKDIVYDPTCGTAGFLVSAFYHVKNNATPQQLNAFKQHGIFGIDQQSPVTALAIVNMIFRGDGKNNIINDNCFARALVPDVADGHPSAKFVPRDNGLKAKSHPVTKVLMNPPFALKKEDEKEYKFVDHALEQMDDGGLLLAIFPVAGMVKQRSYLNWRKRILEENTLLCVISLPHDLFYPQTTQITVILIFRKGIPHPKEQNVLWIRAMTDGFITLKGKRLPDSNASNDLKKAKDLIRAFIHSPNIKVESITKMQKAEPIDFNDKFFELVPEAYLDSAEPSIADIEEEIDSIIRETIGFMLLQHLINGTIKAEAGIKANQEITSKEFSLVPITKIFDIESGDFHNANKLDRGTLPLISCGDRENGLVDMCATPEDKFIRRNSFTIAYNGQPLTTKFHPYQFLSKDDVAVVIPKTGIKNETAIFAASILNLERWRYSYARKCFKFKLLESKIPMPINENGKLDQEWIQKNVKRNPYWNYLASQFKHSD